MPEVFPFRQHIVVHSTPDYQKNYLKYKPSLQYDYCFHCAYCNINDEWVSPAPFQVDHFVPRHTFEKAGLNQLDSQYDNLVYSCPACNRLKGSCFEGDNTLAIIDNLAFYNPNKIEFNNVFYRDELGIIRSNYVLGKKMIMKLCLYRPTKQLSWVLDILNELHKTYEHMIKKEERPERKQELETVRDKIGNTCFHYRQLFASLYKSRD